jgi:hypothetical protein
MNSLLIDENAFGLLVSYFDIENDEYALERELFVERFDEFRRKALEYVAASPPGNAVHALDFGYAIYFEVAQGDERAEPVGWLRVLRTRLKEHEFQTVGVVSYGGRWVDSHSSQPPKGTEQCGGFEIMRLTAPSEPLRKALDADAATRQLDETDTEGWGPGLYVDSEAIEALEKTLKNAPTPLRAGTGTFYRVAR